MIIDCHGHYTTEPKGLVDWRQRQIAAFAEGRALAPDFKVSDDEIRETIEKNQLRIQRERGVDVTLFSPRAGGMAHHVGDETTSRDWTRAVQRRDPSRVHALFQRASSACASCRSRPA
jgi:4-oxalmesaconate hydratase